MATELRRWLQKHPHPVTVRAFDAEGEERTVKLGVARSKWKDAEAALVDCYRLEALDAEGNVLRVCDIEGAPAPAPAATQQGASLVELGRLLEHAADRSAERHSDAYRLAYEQQRLLVEVLSSRLQALEKAWHGLLMAQAQAANGEADPNSGLVAALLAAVGGGMPAPSPSPSNGKAES